MMILNAETNFQTAISHNRKRTCVLIITTVKIAANRADPFSNSDSGVTYYIFGFKFLIFLRHIMNFVHQNFYESNFKTF